MAKIINDQRKRKQHLQLIVNAVFWINATDCQWRKLDSKYPPWQTVFYHFTNLNYVEFGKNYWIIWSFLNENFKKD
ncbi:MAG: transposase [Flavobacterium sp.]